MHRYGYKDTCTKFPNIHDEITQVVFGNRYFQTESLEGVKWVLLGENVSLDCQKIVNRKLINSYNVNDWVFIPVTKIALNFIHIFTIL